MNILERCNAFNVLFHELQSTNSRTTKENMVKYFKRVNPDLQEDLNYIFETLAGKHPIGWTFKGRATNSDVSRFKTIKEVIEACERLTPKTIENTSRLENELGFVGIALEDVLNRTLRLGIGNSQLVKTKLTPMLAKKYDGQTLNNPVFVTEKLDGNRCIAHYDGDKWCFTSRSGKPLNVNFDMTGLDTDCIYDGEIMSTQQTLLSAKRYQTIIDKLPASEFGYDTKQSQLLFNQTSGLINRHGEKSGLVYNIFDFVSDACYYARREYLNTFDLNHTQDVRILPVLYTGTDTNKINTLLDMIVQMGGEGIMLNISDRGYENKRTDALMKYKQVQFMDMLVVDVVPGSGKYTGLIGALTCAVKTDDGKLISCDVGTGLSDAQREQWAIDTDQIIGKIVQVGYHELTQDRTFIGTNVYSLRFPRLIKVRDDKNETSEY